MSGTKTWDIIDRLEPNVQITVIKKSQPKLTSGFSSVVKTAFFMTIAIAAAGNARFVKKFDVISGNVHVKKANQSVTPSRRVRGNDSVTDTQFGQSSSKLAQAFNGLFQPAKDEADTEDDNYSFA